MVQADEPAPLADLLPARKRKAAADKAEEAIAVLQMAWVTDARAQFLHSLQSQDSFAPSEKVELQAAHVQRTFFPMNVTALLGDAARAEVALSWTNIRSQKKI